MIKISYNKSVVRNTLIVLCKSFIQYLYWCQDAILDYIELKFDSFDKEFCIIVEFIVLFVEFLFKQSLTNFLNIFSNTIAFRFRLLHFVLRVSIHSHISIRTFHLSFNEFLLNDQFQSKFFEISSQTTYRMLLFQCLRLLFEFKNLQKNFCRFEYFDKRRREINSTTIDDRLSLALQYACQHWIHIGESGKRDWLTWLTWVTWELLHRLET